MLHVPRRAAAPHALTPVTADHQSSKNLVPADRPGISLLRAQASIRRHVVPAKKILLYVHCMTYPSETLFDLKLNGLSWMDYIAQHGYDVYLVDHRLRQVHALPRWTSPPRTARCAARNGLKDVGAAVDFILKRRGVSKINLLWPVLGHDDHGVSNTAQNNDKVQNQLTVLYAQLNGSAKRQHSRTPEPAACTSPCCEARRMALQACPRYKKAGPDSASWFGYYREAPPSPPIRWTEADAPMLRAPNGTVQGHASSGVRARRCTTRPGFASPPSSLRRGGR